MCMYICTCGHLLLLCKENRRDVPSPQALIDMYVHMYLGIGVHSGDRYETKLRVSFLSSKIWLYFCP